MRFARRVFFWSGVYGIVAVAPMYFLEEALGRAFPPPPSHPEIYYAFVGVTVAWQLVFLAIARDPVRYRPLMPLAVAEKLLPSGAALWLLAAGRVEIAAVAPYFVDLVLGALFVASYLVTSRDAAPA